MIISFIVAWFVMVENTSEVEFGEVFGADAVDDDFHQFKESYAEGDNGDHDSNSVVTEESEFEKFTREWDEEGTGHDYNDRKDECGAQFIEWAREPVDKKEINRERDKNRGGSKFEMSEMLKMRNNGQYQHTDRNCDADRDRIFDNVTSKTVLDAFGIVFKS